MKVIPKSPKSGLSLLPNELLMLTHLKLSLLPNPFSVRKNRKVTMTKTKLQKWLR